MPKIKLFKNVFIHLTNGCSPIPPLLPVPYSPTFPHPSSLIHYSSKNRELIKTSSGLACPLLLWPSKTVLPGGSDQKAGNKVHVTNSPNSITRGPTWSLQWPYLCRGPINAWFLVSASVSVSPSGPLLVDSVGLFVELLQVPFSYAHFFIRLPKDRPMFSCKPQHLFRSAPDWNLSEEEAARLLSATIAEYVNSIRSWLSPMVCVLG